MGRQGHGGQMNLWEARWSEDESQWPTRVLVRVQGGVQRGLLFIIPNPEIQGGRGGDQKNLAVAEA